MLATDNATTANFASNIFQDDRAIQFHDPSKLAGKIIAESLGAQHAVAWDMYLFYEKGSQWAERPPLPLDWAHQLDHAWADPNRFAWGDGLIVRLREIVNDLTKESE